MKSSDVSLMEELTRRLEQLCREGEEIRRNIAQSELTAPLWPMRQDTSLPVPRPAEARRSVTPREGERNN